VVPVAFTFPGAGSLLTLLFVPYAAWFSGRPLGLADYGNLFGSGVFATPVKVLGAPPTNQLPTSSSDARELPHFPNENWPREYALRPLWPTVTAEALASALTPCIGGRAE
jgi:hypothetical protein